MKNLSKNLLSILLVILMSVPNFAFADSASAQVFYESAAAAYGRGEYSEAAELLYKAYANDPNLIYAYNRILALQADKQYKAALREMGVFETQMKKDPAKRFEDVEQIKAKLVDQVKASESLKKDPVVKKDDKVIEGGKKGEIKPLEPVKEGMPGNEVLGLTLMGAGAIPLIIGIAFSTEQLLDEGSVTANKVDAVRKTKNNFDKKAAIALQFDGSKDAYEKAESQVSFHETLAISLIGVGSALILGGGYFYFFGGSDDGATSVPTSADAGEFNIEPYVSTDRAGANFRLTF